MDSANCCSSICIGERNSSASISPGCVGSRFVGTRIIVSILRHSMVIDYLDLLGSGVSPNKTDSILLIDANTLLTSAIGSERFQLIPRRNSQLLQGRH